MRHSRLHRRTAIFAAWPLALMLATAVGCSSSNNPVVPPGDTVAPTVSATNPLNGATGVAVAGHLVGEMSD